MEHDVTVPHARGSEPAAAGAASLATQWVEVWLTRDHREVLRILRRLPVEVLLSDPALLFLAGSLGALPAADAWRASAELLGSHSPGAAHTSRARVPALLAQANLYRRAGQYPQALELAARAGQLLDASCPRELRTLTLHEIAVVALLCGEVERARVTLETAYDELAGLAPAVRRHLGALLALLSALAGELTRADALLGELGQLGPWRGRPGPAETDAVLLARLLLHLDRWDLALAESLLRSRAPASFGWLWPVALHTQVQHALLTGRHAQGLRLVSRIGETTQVRLPDCSLARDVVREARASLLLAAGDLRASWDSLEHGRPRGVGCQVVEVAVLYASGEQEPGRYLARAVLSSRELTRRQRTVLLGLELGLAMADGEDRSTVRVATLVAAAGAQRWRSVVAHLPPTVLHRIPEESLSDVQRRAVAEDPVIPWIPAPVVRTPLSPRERLVLDLLVSGAPRSLVAERLDVSVNTVKTHVRHLYAKLGVRNGAELVRLVRRLPRSSTLLEVEHLEA